jgi:DnaJ-class molecular chaperone
MKSLPLNSKKKIPGEGMPIYRSDDYLALLTNEPERGDLYVQFDIILPRVTDYMVGRNGPFTKFKLKHVISE